MLSQDICIIVYKIKWLLIHLSSVVILLVTTLTTFDLFCLSISTQLFFVFSPLLDNSWDFSSSL